MAERAYGLTRSQAALVRETVLAYLRSHGGTKERRDRNQTQRTRRATNETAVTAPTTSLVAMTTFTFYFITLNEDGTSTVGPDGPYTGYNNDPDFTADRGTLLSVEWKEGRWQIYGAACSPQDALITALDAL